MTAADDRHDDGAVEAFGGCYRLVIVPSVGVPAL